MIPQAGKPGFQGFVFQGAAYEGLTCDGLEWIYSYHGGTIIDRNKKVTINNPNAIKALDLAKSWVGTIAPRGVTVYQEEQARNLKVLTPPLCAIGRTPTLWETRRRARSLRSLRSRSFQKVEQKADSPRL